MRKLLIDIADLGGRAMPDDKVTLWAPFHRESLSNPNRVVSTARVDVDLDGEGKAEVMVDPGPLRIQFKCRGFSDTEVKRAVVPEDGDEDVLLKDILSGSYVYEPEVVSAARQAADRAEADADRAEADADRAEADADRAEAGADRVGTAEQVGVWADRASTAAEGTADDRRQTGEDRGVVEATAIEVADDRRQTGEDRAQTGRDAEAAEGWAGQSKDAATLAITAAATVTQYVGDGFPEGKVTAPVGSIYVDRQATAGAVRWIKTSGSGSTGWEVEYGKTRSRRIASDFYNDTEGVIADQGAVSVSRTNDLVSLTIYNLKVSKEGSQSLRASLPPGFTPTETMNFPGVIAGGPGARLSVTPSGIVRIYGLSSTDWHDHFFSLVWPTTDNWPSTLPGVPS